MTFSHSTAGSEMLLQFAEALGEASRVLGLGSPPSTFMAAMHAESLEGKTEMEK